MFPDTVSNDLIPKLFSNQVNFQEHFIIMITANVKNYLCCLALRRLSYIWCLKFTQPNTTQAQLSECLCTFLLLLGKSPRWPPMLQSEPSIGTHQCVCSHNAAFHSVRHFTNVPRQNNYTLCMERSPQPTNRNTNIATEEQNVYWAPSSFFF